MRVEEVGSESGGGGEWKWRKWEVEVGSEVEEVRSESGGGGE